MSKSSLNGKGKGIPGGGNCICKDLEAGNSMGDFGKSRVPGVTMGGRDFSERLTEGELYWGLQGRIPRDGGWKHRERNGSLMHLHPWAQLSLLRGCGIPLQMQFSWSPKVGQRGLGPSRGDRVFPLPCEHQLSRHHGRLVLFRS